MWIFTPSSQKNHILLSQINDNNTPKYHLSAYIEYEHPYVLSTEPLTDALYNGLSQLRLKKITQQRPL